MRYCQVNILGYPLPGWNFLAKVNTHVHILFIGLLLLTFIKQLTILNPKLLTEEIRIGKGLIWVDIIYSIQKIIVQILGLIFGTLPPTWCNQRIIGFIITLGILVTFLLLYKKEFTLIINRLITKIKYKLFESILELNISVKPIINKLKSIWQKIFGI